MINIIYLLMGLLVQSIPFAAGHIFCLIYFWLKKRLGYKKILRKFILP